MNILCSTEKGQMSREACLACALETKGAPCGYDYALLKALFGDVEQEKRRGEIHVTDLTGCLRKSFLDKTNPSPEYVHEKMLRWMGQAVHAHAEGEDEYLKSELAIAHDGIVGRADIVYRDGRVADFKTTRWLYPSKLPYGSHELQVNIYAWMLRKMGREVKQLQIQYIDMSGPSKCRACRLPVRMISGELKCPKCLKTPSSAHLGAVLCDVSLMTDAEVENVILGRKEQLAGSIEMGLMPEAEPGYLCAYCSSYQQVCWPETTE